MPDNGDSKKKRPTDEIQANTDDLSTQESGALASMTPEETVEMVRQNQAAAMEGFRSMTAPLGASSPLGPLGAGATSTSTIDMMDSLERGGPAFGAFVKAIGLAVAEAQQKLDETLVTTAKALSDTQIEVVAVFEQEITNDGTMGEGKVHLQKLPLVNYLMPTAYQWSRVYLQADMQVKEFNVDNGFNIKSQATSFGVNARANYSMFGGFGAGGSTNFNTSSASTNGDTSYAREEAAGTLHMEATLEPRTDIRLPQPFIVQKGPRLKVTAGARQDILGTPPAPVPPATTSGPAPVVGRRLTLTIELRDKVNNPLSGKLIEYRISQPLLNYSPTPTDGKTGADGTLTLTLERRDAAYDATRPPETVMVNVWFGLVAEQVVVTI